MTTELQNKVWSILPKEFKEEVKEIYLNAVEHHPCGYNHKTDLLKYLFGRQFLEGHYQCTDCGLTEYEQKVIGSRIELSPITYYSDCFYRVKKQPSLFEL